MQSAAATLSLALAAAALTLCAACDDPKHGLSRSQIEQTMTDRGPELKRCWKATGPHGELKLHVAITTKVDGQVDSAVADSKDKTVNACLEKQIKAWTFAKTGEPTKFSLPVNFKR